MDVTKILAIVEAIVAAAPAIEEGIADIGVYVSAIETMIKNGGNPSDAEWTNLKMMLDTGSASLQSAAQDALAQEANDASTTQE